MTPAPGLQELIDTIRRDAYSDDALAQLATASQTVTELSETGDAALGYFVDRARGAGRSWVEISSVLGVSKQAAHKRFAVSWTTRPAFDRYTERTKRVVESASATALQHKHNYVGTEHLLLAFFTEPGAIATRVLTAHDISSERVTAAVVEMIPDGDTDVDVEPTLTPRANHVLQGAVAEALELGHNYVGTEHILLAFYRDSGGVAPRVLLELGLDGDTARAEITELLAQ